MLGDEGGDMWIFKVEGEGDVGLVRKSVEVDRQAERRWSGIGSWVLGEDVVHSYRRFQALELGGAHAMNRV